ncbi:precorrin-3B C17-methyltransferase [Salmonella enterica subsp. enterica serovar Typhimurium]|nr:precorrin-3B C17-methyltransferase [Salmonella enterica subsp. enterica serovar Typhimurium]
MLSVIGIGPGSQAMMTMEAIEALQAAEIVVGYKTYHPPGESLYRR